MEQQSVGVSNTGFVSDEDENAQSILLLKSSLFVNDSTKIAYVLVGATAVEIIGDPSPALSLEHCKL